MVPNRPNTSCPGLSWAVANGCQGSCCNAFDEAYADTWVALHASFRSDPTHPASTGSSESQSENSSSGESKTQDDDDRIDARNGNHNKAGGQKATK